jgi:signal transduction histidine kinase
MDKKWNILIIDDEAGIRQGSCRILQSLGFTVETAASFQEGLSKIQANQYDLVLLDLMLPDGKGVDLLEPIHARDPETVCVIITGYATVELAVDTIKRGAYDFISKPFTADMLQMKINRGIEKRRLSLDARRMQAIENEAIELTRARDEAERLNEFKTSFLYMVAHELRSPLSGAQSLVRILLQGLAGDLTAQQSELLGRVATRLDFLLSLINDLLTLAASKSIGVDQPLELVHLQPLVTKVIESFKDEAAGKKVAVNFTASRKKIMVEAVERELNTVLRNLLGNAIKYTPEGGSVLVEISQEQPRVRIAVVDTGIGIPEEDLPHIFEEFFRAKNAHHSGIPGTGLGMSIVKQFVERMGGQVGVASVLGKGTTFTVWLNGT